MGLATVFGSDEMHSINHLFGDGDLARDLVHESFEHGACGNEPHQLSTVSVSDGDVAAIPGDGERIT